MKFWLDSALTKGWLGLDSANSADSALTRGRLSSIRVTRPSWPRVKQNNSIGWLLDQSRSGKGRSGPDSAKSESERPSFWTVLAEHLSTCLFYSLKCCTENMCATSFSKKCQYLHHFVIILLFEFYEQMHQT